MSVKNKWSWIVLTGLLVLIKIFSLFPDAVEKYYSTGFYPVIARAQRMLLGWVPFSVGDIGYCCLAAWLLYSLFHLIRRLVRHRASPRMLLDGLLRIVYTCLFVYAAFNILWGLNYNRRGISAQLQIKEENYSTGDLETILGVIVDRLDTLYPDAIKNRQGLQSNGYLFDGAAGAYGNLAAQKGIFRYASPSVKPSLFSYLGNYLGFTGYYNPFSGEAQVNTTVPAFIRPFTTCHEIGHQLGYAKENEANFVGYLSAKSASDPAFRYSVYFDLYLYAASDLYTRDTSLLRPFKERLHPGIRIDYKILQKFLVQYENPMEPYIRRLYGRYLRANEQPHGIMSYNDVIGRLIAYYKKYGAAAI